MVVWKLHCFFQSSLKANTASLRTQLVEATITVVKREWNSTFALNVAEQAVEEYVKLAAVLSHLEKRHHQSQGLSSLVSQNFNGSSQSWVLGICRLFSVLFLWQLLSGCVWSFTLCIHRLALKPYATCYMGALSPFWHFI